MKDGGIGKKMCEIVSCLNVMDKLIVNYVMDVQYIPGLVLETK
jgi:hypothetical protein